MILRSECPACRAPVSLSVKLFDTGFWQGTCAVMRCSCGLVYKKSMPSQDDLANLYSEGYTHFQLSDDAAGPAEILSARQKLARACRFLPETPPRGWRLLDVGCAAGTFVSIARQLGFQAEGLDEYLPENRQNEFLRRGGIDSLPTGSFDLVTLLNVAEHLVDPWPLLSGAYRLLRPGGVLLLTCPYGAGLACRIYRNRWVHMTLDEHLLFWTPASLTRILRAVGFQGPVDYRIAGSPFPYGRTGHSPRSLAGNPGKPLPEIMDPRQGLSGMTFWEDWQQRAWKIARWIQRREALANSIRALVHWTRTGDYLEVAIGKGL
ncbi:MAG: class I SAM-dependent methyltransferase [Elusimicrobiota bacterium]